MRLDELFKTKAMVFDIDGTLCDIDHVISDETKLMFKKLQKTNIRLGLASGRAISGINDHYLKWGLGRDFDFYIGMNGGMLLDNLKHKYSNSHLMDVSQARIVSNHMKVLGLPASYYCDDDVNYLVGVNEEVEASIKRNAGNAVFKEIDEDLNELKDKKIYRILYRVPIGMMDDVKKYIDDHPFDGFYGMQTQEICYEVMLKGMDKSEALKIYCKDNEISLDEVCAFGDNDNDNMMLECCFGVCLSNGNEDTKRLAKAITKDDAYHSGVARFVTEYILR